MAVMFPFSCLLLSAVLPETREGGCFYKIKKNKCLFNQYNTNVRQMQQKNEYLFENNSIQWKFGNRKKLGGVLKLIRVSKLFVKFYKYMLQ